MPGQAGPFGAGRDNYALDFDGKSSYVDIPTLTYDGTHPITLEATVTPAEVKNSAILTDTQYGGVGLNLGGGQSIQPWRFTVSDESGRRHYVYASGDKSANAGQTVVRFVERVNRL